MHYTEGFVLVHFVFIYKIKMIQAKEEKTHEGIYLREKADEISRAVKGGEINYHALHKGAYDVYRKI